RLVGRRTVLGMAGVGLVAAVLAAPASASQLIDRDATGVKLEVNKKGQALVTYHVHGKLRHVLAWGAINAREPAGDAKPAAPQVKFRLDYSGGWGTYRKLVWKTFKDACQPYHGPEIAMAVAECQAPDGSNWALQSWQVELPDLGFDPWTAEQKRWHLQL